jgi:hypothetical protein
MTEDLIQKLMISKKIMEKKPVNTKTFNNTTEKILNSKLPDAIKNLMIEHPIQQPQQLTPVLSDDIIEKAARLMNNNKDTIVETVNNKKSTIPQQQTQSNSDLRKMLKEVVTEVLTEKGIIHESEQKSQQMVQIKVGNHIFEGKISKIKKLK